MCGCIIRFDPARLQGSIAAVLEVGCRLLLIAECRETLRLRGDARGCNGHRRRRMVRQQPTRVRCPSRLRERRDCSQSLFFKFSWTSGMLPGLATLNLKVKFSERLSEDLQTVSPAKTPSWWRSERERERRRCGWRCGQRSAAQTFSEERSPS